MRPGHHLRPWSPGKTKLSRFILASDRTCRRTVQFIGGPRGKAMLPQVRSNGCAKLRASCRDSRWRPSSPVLLTTKANHRFPCFPAGTLNLDSSGRVLSTCKRKKARITRACRICLSSVCFGPYLTRRQEEIHSHSIVAGGFPEMSYTTRFKPRTSLMMRFDTRPSSSCGRCAQCAVMKS